ncbi:MAG: ATP-binding protein [Bacteroidales bacterium]|nr:ATP-binding protein [Bacteroidales bacterium]
MIIDFSVKNFRSFKDLQTISFATTGLKSAEKYADIDKNNIVNIEDVQLFKTIGIYGANASGKSNIIKALVYFVKAITNEPSSESNMSSLCDPFLYQDCEEDSYFQITLMINKKKYRYGFTVKQNTQDIGSIDEKISKEKISKEKISKEIITNEWLFGVKEKNMGEFFTRKGNKISNDKLPNKDKIPPLPYEHALYLTHAAAFDRNGVCQKIRNFFTGFVVSNLYNDHESFRWYSIFYLKSENQKKQFLNLLSSFNLKYEDATLLDEEESSKKNIFPQNKILLSKKYTNSNYEISDINLNLQKNESSGTQKLFDLAGLLLTAYNLSSSALIILDEIDSNFHPYLLIKLIEFFNNPSVNKSNSQLLFTSHDTNLMSPSIMRRDQFYLTEKNEDNSTRLYSLADLKGIRNDADFAKQYLAGYYGALPILEDYLQINNSKDD